MQARQAEEGHGAGFRQALSRGQADAHAGERARASDHGDGRKLRDGQAAEDFADGGQESLRRAARGQNGLGRGCR